MALNAIVRTNITAVNAHRQLSGAGITQTKASERLASGQRINSAADDAAGLGIVEKMRAQIVGLDRASLNAQDGMSLVQTAEGALSSINDALIRIRELVIQAANDTYVHDPNAEFQSDRAAIQHEIDQLLFEINNIAYRTEFNTRTLLSGELSEAGVIRGGNVHSLEEVRINRPAQLATLDQFLRFPANEQFVGSFSELLAAIGADLSGLDAGEWIAVHAGTNFSGLEEALDEAMGVVYEPITDPLDPDYPGYFRADNGRWDQLPQASGLTFNSARELLDSFIQSLHNPNVLRPGTIAWNAPQQPFANWQDFLDNANPEMGASTFARAMSSSGGTQIYQALRNYPAFGLNSESTFSDVRNVFYRLGGLDGNGGWGESAGLTAWVSEALNNLEGSQGTRSWMEMRFNREFPNTPEGNAEAWDLFVQTYLRADADIVHREVWIADENQRERGIPLWFQIGANSGQGILVGINGMSTRALAEPHDLVDLIDVEQRSGRPISYQVDYLDAALMHVNRERAFLGAVHNRLEFAQIGLDISSENLTAAMSRIRDADMAKELMSLYSANVLTQAATAMIAHANQAPQAVLELLQ